MNANFKRVTYLLLFVVLTLSYAFNLFKVSTYSDFNEFDKFDELFMIDRLYTSKKEGVFSYSGLPHHIRKDTTSIKDIIEPHNEAFLSGGEIEGSPDIYMSQPGGQGIIYSLIQKLNPADNSVTLLLVHIFSAVLTALMFVLFLKWTEKRFNIYTMFIVFFLLFISTWINNFAHHIWWVLWSFFLPFIVVLLFMEKESAKGKSIRMNRLLILLFISFCIKCFVTGFEFITTTIIAALCPLVYYAIINNDSLKKLTQRVVLSASSILLAVISISCLLIVQIKMLYGSYNIAIDHLLFSFKKRSTFEATNTEYVSSFSLLKEYMRWYPFRGELVDFHLRFGGLLTIILFLSVVLYFIVRKYYSEKMQEVKALLITALLSLLAPLSWLLIFKQHAVIHTHIDPIIFYIPTLLFAFIIVGYTVYLLVLHCKKIKSKL